jgi:CRISPR-associated protein Cmr3
MMVSATTASWIGLRIDPLDTLFFRDGRPFDAANRVVGGLPNPQTLAGAIRTALLARTGFRFADFARERKKTGDVEAALQACRADPGVIDAHLRGPFLALAGDNDRIEPLLPRPLTLARAKDNGERWSWAMPGAFAGWQDPDRLLPLVRVVDADPKAEPELLTLTGLKAFLDGADPGSSHAVRPEELYGHDNRIGIVVDGQTLASAEGQLYAIRLLALKPKWEGRRVCLYAELAPGAEGTRDYRHLLHDTPVPFGGEGKYVQVKTVAPVAWPEADARRERSVWYLATPTFLPFRGGDETRRPRLWLPRPLPAVPELKAAMSGPGLAVSGWDVAANGPRPTRFAVPAGAVYFLDGPGDENAFLHHDDPNELRNLQREGWGFALQGKWENNSGR